ncbi:MAG: RecX family transcriptional regulator [Mediterranea sp.]|jgi:regulatory protein|nr:RecX family transcriptional regulator [Mediterranea sp.]
MSVIKETEAIKRIAGYCAKSEQSRADAYEKMKKWGFGNKTIEGMLDALETSGFINDDRFSRSFVNDKFRLSKWGRLKIAQALDLRKIPEAVYQPYLNDIDEEEYTATLRCLLDMKKRSIQGKNKEEKEAKLVRFALSRGFEMQYIEQCLDLPDRD